MGLAKWGYLCLLRLAVFVGLLSAVVTVIYLTPIPDLHHASCIRPCHDLDWPMICRFKLIFEHHQTMGGWCGDCPKNITDCFKSECILADGNTAKIVAVNKQLPGLSMQVCENDIIVVEVENRVAGGALAVHWAGQPQIGTPYMDGVPMITQCPIQPYTTFQYKFRANQHGTHFWKAHTGNELLDNTFGAIIVRRSERVEVMGEYYDEDRPEHFLLISEWISPGASSSLPTILINGISSKLEDLVPRLKVEQGKKYRIRVAYTHGVTSCPVFLSISGHTMLVIALDGHYIMPRNTSSILMAPGERFDFVLSTNRIEKDYSLRVESNCTEKSGLAKLEYNTTSLTEQDSISEPPKALKLSKVISTVTRQMCQSSEGVLCLQHIESQKKMPSYLEKVDTKLFLPFDLVRTPGDPKPRMDNISFAFPPAPLISQPDDSFTSPIICNSERKPKFCPEGSLICECTHIINIPLNNIVELVLVDQGSGSSDGRVFHLHGYSFYVFGVAVGLDNLTPQQVKDRHASGSLFSPMSVKPVKKDTIAVPKRGAVALRFKATNPGYWVLHDQSSSLWSEGMNVVFKVGQPSDLPAIPDEFPVCGSWVGPEFFLI